MARAIVGPGGGLVGPGGGLVGPGGSTTGGVTLTAPAVVEVSGQSASPKMIVKVQQGGLGLPAVGFEDDFGRTVVQGLGGGWVWSNDDSHPATSAGTAIASVNGSEVIVANDPSHADNWYESYRHPFFDSLDDDSSGQFDFWVPADITDLCGYGVSLKYGEIIAASDSAAGSGSPWAIDFFNQTPTTPYVFTPDASSYYTLKWQIRDRHVSAKVWKTGTSEPGWQFELDSAINAGLPVVRPFLDFYYVPLTEPAKLDNLQLDGYRAFLDHFDRSTSDGLGNGWTKSDDESSSPLVLGYCDGVSLRFFNSATVRKESWRHPDLPAVDSGGIVEWEFTTPAAPNTEHWAFGLALGHRFYYVYSTTSWFGASGHDTLWRLQGWNEITFSVLPSTIYVARVKVNVGRADQAKVWKRSDPEPFGWQDLGTYSTSTTPSPPAYLDAYEIPINEQMRIDNLLVIKGSFSTGIEIIGHAPGPGIAALTSSAVVEVSGQIPTTEGVWPGPPERGHLGDPVNQTYAVTISPDAAGGTFTLTADHGLGSSGPIPYNATASVLQTLLRAVWYPGINVTGSTLPGGTLTIEFAGTLAGTRVVVTGDYSGLTRPPVSLPPTVVGQASGTSSNSTSIFVGIPAAAIGDQIVITVTADALGNSSFDIPDPPGWTRLRRTMMSNGDQILISWMHVQDGTLPALVGISWTGNRDSVVVVSAIHNFGGFELSGDVASLTPNNHTHTTPSIGTPSSPNELLLVAWAAMTSGTWSALSSSMGQLRTANVTWASLAVATQPGLSAGAIGTRSIDFTGASGDVSDLMQWFAAKPLVVTPVGSGSIDETHSGTGGGFGGGGGSGGGTVGGIHPDRPGDVQLIYDEIGDNIDIAPDVIFASAEFISATNGKPGGCRFRMREYLSGPARTFVTGKRLTLKFKGINQWTGYLSQRRMVFAFSADDPTKETLRLYEVQGADINILFRKRYIYRTDGPNDGANGSEAMVFPIKDGPTSDIKALTELFAHWVDLTGDDIDTVSLVQGVADVNVDQDSLLWQRGDTWEMAMQQIAQIPAPVYCLDPDRRLVWADVNDRSEGVYILEDIQSKTAASYREVEIIRDGSDLVTDVMAWGMGVGSGKRVFKRIQSDPEGHGPHWQDGEVLFTVYKQKTLDRIASSVINGSPASHRGHKYDKVGVVCKTFVPGFRSGQRVGFRSFGLGYVDTIPIRQVRITFPAPNTPLFELTMGHEIDEPWDFYDNFIPNLPAIQDFPIPAQGSGLGGQIGPCRNGSVNAIMVSDNFEGDTLTATDWPGPCGTWYLSGGDVYGRHILKSPPPHCYLIAVPIGSSPSGLVQIGDAGLSDHMRAALGIPNYGAGYNGSWSAILSGHSFSVTVNPEGGWTGATAGGSVVVHANVPQLVRVVRFGNEVWGRSWPADMDEPTDWAVANFMSDGTIHFGGGLPPFAGTPYEDFVSAYQMGGTLSLTYAVPLAVIISGGDGYGYAQYDRPFSDIDNRFNRVDHRIGKYHLRFFPGCVAPANYPHDPPSLQPIDGWFQIDGSPALLPTGVAGASRGDGSTYASGIGGGDDGPDPQTLFQINSGWNASFGPPMWGGWGTTQSDGRISARDYYVYGYEIPPGAYAYQLECDVFAFSPGNMPTPSGESAIPWELWNILWQPGDSIPPAHTVIASGSLSDFNWYGGFGVILGSIFEHVNITVPCAYPGKVQLGGALAFTDSYYINNFNPSTAGLIAVHRDLQFKMLNVKMRFLWHAEDCVPFDAGGDVTVPITGISDRVIQLHPYFWGTTRVWRNGKALQIDIDYEETDPSNGILTLTDTPVITYRYVIQYRAQQTNSGGHGLPNQLKLRPSSVY